MLITNIIQKLLEDYSIVEFQVNETIKYSFPLGEYITNIYYTKKDGRQNELDICIECNDIQYMFTLPFSCDEEENYHINTYLSNEIYECLRTTILQHFKYHKTTPYFEGICNTILHNTPVVPHPATKPATPHFHPNNYYDDKPFFQTMVRMTMSTRMQKKIIALYPPEEAEKIFSYCGNTFTLRFTSDPKKEKEITIYIS